MRSLAQIIRDDLTKEEKASLHDIEDKIRFSISVLRQAQRRLDEQVERKAQFFDYKKKQMGMA
jgi:hypothetical protein